MNACHAFIAWCGCRLPWDANQHGLCLNVGCCDDFWEDGNEVRLKDESIGLFV